MCGDHTQLQESHIFPRSYFKFIKDGDPQVWEIKTDDQSTPYLSNLNPKEPLLCFTCEQFISKKYESYGTQIFRRNTNIEKGKDYVKIKNFKYSDFYLFMISILWRASISSLDRYNHIKFNDEINNTMLRCIKNSSTKVTTSLRLEHIFRPFVFRIKDRSNQLDDDSLKKIFLDLRLRKPTTDSTDYFWFIQGFLFILKTVSSSDIHDLRTRKYAWQIKDKTYIKIPFVDITQIPELANAVMATQRKLKAVHRLST